MSPSVNDPAIQFAEMVSSEDAAIDLARAALAFARHEYPHLGVESYARRIDHLAAAVRSRAGAAAGPGALIAALNETLFVRERMRGNTANYYDPRNSFLNEVLDRKVGIPITLSCVYMEVGRRAGLEIDGVALPGHFIVKHRMNGACVLRDPFDGGRVLTPDDCQRKVREIIGGGVSVSPCWFESCSKKKILARMLGNLKGIYLRSRDFKRALWTVEGILAIDPGCVEQIRDRGMIHLHLHDLPKAIADLEWYLRFAPKAEDAHDVCEIVRKLRALHAGLN
jgi:regulator of sirC expression with transglutaminase-like and TPR domain